MRQRQQRNLLTTLLLSQGVPMVLGGDEMGRTQQGNNNAYAQDSELSWYDWEGADTALLEFTRRLSALRREHPAFRRRKWFQGRPIHGEQADDLEWFTPEGVPMTEEDWQVGYARSIAVFLNGEAIAALGAQGQRVLDDSFFAIFNAYGEELEFVLPDGPYAERWEVVVDTSQLDPDLAFPVEGPEHKALDRITVPGHAVVVLRAAGPA